MKEDLKIRECVTGRVKFPKTGLGFDSLASFENSLLVALARCDKKHMQMILCRSFEYLKID